MVLQAVTPDNKNATYSYQFIWQMDKQHCLHFIDAIINIVILADGQFGNLIYRVDEDGEAISLRDEFIATSDVFELFSKIKEDVKTVGVMVCLNDIQYFIEVAVDTDYCSVYTAPAGDTELDLNNSPDFLMDKAEILAHLGYDRLEREEPNGTV